MPKAYLVCCKSDNKGEYSTLIYAENEKDLDPIVWELEKMYKKIPSLENEDLIIKEMDSESNLENLCQQIFSKCQYEIKDCVNCNLMFEIACNGFNFFAKFPCVIYSEGLREYFNVNLIGESYKDGNDLVLLKWNDEYKDENQGVFFFIPDEDDTDKIIKDLQEDILKDLKITLQDDMEEEIQIQFPDDLKTEQQEDTSEESIFTIPITWQMFGYLEVKAKTREEAISKIYEMESSDEPHELPDGDYVDGSIEIDEEVYKTYL